MYKGVDLMFYVIIRNFKLINELIKRKPSIHYYFIYTKVLEIVKKINK